MCRVTMGNTWLTNGYLRAIVGHPRVTIGHFRVTIGFFSISKHKANTTELHPKVRQTCLILLLQKSLVARIEVNGA